MTLGIDLPADEAWALGVFEGEGSIVKDTVGYGYLLSIQMSDKDIIDRFHRIVGIGKIGGPYQPKGKPTYKQTWTWRCGATKIILPLLERWLPYFSVRRSEKAIEAIEALSAILAAEIYCKRYCKHGHLRTAENTYIDPKGRIANCRDCGRLRAISYRERRGK